MSLKIIRALKITGLVIALLAAIILAATFTLDTEFSVERSVVIDQPKEVVFDYIRYLENQNSYSVWVARDPGIRLEYRGTDGTVGAVSAWNGSEESGSGEQEITGIAEGERVDFELRFFEPFESTSYAYKSTESVSENQTLVTWGMYGSFPRPMNLMLLFFDLEEAIGDDYETGLENLKQILENQ
ncbi:SRPBCC family protein [Rhodohalobacter halophilus]|uniref:SRPBCC family protein n=1 Tax=Rhodohalobacter halophilus TaxID=1812810 RepID=UPI000A006A2B|nr:SRPBCC family protein [Rhodohalobacter halophilus]